MSKEVKGRAKLNLAAGKATPAPPVGPVISPLGINIKQFCDQFNELTRDKVGFRIPVEVIAYKDKSFDLILNQPSVYSLITNTISIQKGAKAPKTEVVGVLSKENLKKVAEIKMPDFNTNSLESAMRIVAGTARSMGVKVEE